MRYPPYVFVFAGSMREVEYWRVRKMYSLKQVRWVRNGNDLRGWHFDPPLKMPSIGTFGQHKDDYLLEREAEQRGIELVHGHHPNIYDPRNAGDVSSFL